MKALAGVAQWMEHQPVSQKVTGSVPHQGTCVGFGPGPQLGLYKRQPIGFSPSLSLSLPLSLKINT